MKWSGSIIAFFISALGLVGGVLALTRHALSQPDSLHYSVRGIDVSHHQGAINWPVVARACHSYHEQALLLGNRFQTQYLHIHLR